MNNKVINEKIEKMNDELNKLSTKIKDSTDTMVIKSMYAKDELDEKIKEARKNLDETKKVLTNVGTHRIAFNLWSGNGQYDINITKENRNVKVVFKLSMGLVTSKPKIISIENI